MRLLVRDIVLVTPPNRGSYGRRHGEAVITADLLRIFKPVSERSLEAFSDFYGAKGNELAFGHKGAKPIGVIQEKVLRSSEMAAWHASRRRADGRVMQVHAQVTTGLRKRDLRGLDVGLVSRPNFERFREKVIDKVGLLASGWNAAAAKLGLKLPAWITRHGTSRGEIELRITETHFTILITNSVKFAGEVKGLERRVQFALDNRGNQMMRRLEHVFAGEARKAGF